MKKLKLKISIALNDPGKVKRIKKKLGTLKTLKTHLSDGLVTSDEDVFGTATSRDPLAVTLVTKDGRIVRSSEEGKNIINVSGLSGLAIEPNLFVSQLAEISNNDASDELRVL